MLQRPTLRRTLLAACMLAAFSAHAEQFDFNLPAQDLAASLEILSSKSHVRLMYSPEAVKGIAAPALNGQMTPEQALAKLLQGSGLTWSEADGVIAIKPRTMVSKPATEPAELEPVTVTATRTVRRVDEVPASVSVISARDLRRQPLRKPQDALRNIEGIDFNANTSTGAADIPQIRGIGGSFAGTTSSVLVDGMVTDSPISSVVGRGGFNFLAPQDIERMEVVRGPASALYGPNVVGGVVNVIAKRWMGEPGAEVNAEFGSHNSRALGVAAGMANDRFDIRLSAYDFRTDGYIADPVDLRSRSWQDRKWNLNGALRPADDQEISFGFQQYRTNQDHFSGPVERSGKDEGDAYTLGYRKEFASHASFKAGYRHAILLQSYINPKGGMGIGNRKSISDTVDTQVDLQPIEHNALSFGASYQAADHNTVNLIAATDSRSSAKSTGVFIQDEHRFGALALTVGARYDRIDLSPDTVNDVPKNGRSSVADVVNPRLGASYHLTESTSFYASAGTAYLPALNSFKFVRPPSTTRVDNPGLKPESSTSYELGMNNRWSIGTLRTVLFHTDYKDKIALGTDVASGNGQWQNIAVVKVNGLELAYQGNLGHGWEPYANYSYTKARDYATPGAPGTQSTRMSPRKLNAGVTYAPGGAWSATLNARYVSGRYFNNLTQAQWAGSYTQVDAKVSAKLPFQGEKWEAFLAVNNLTDKKYEPFNKGEWSDGRTISIGLNGRF